MSDYDNRLRANLGIRKVVTSKNIVLGVNTTVQQGESASFLLWESFEKPYTALDSGITQTNTARFNIDPYLKWSTGKINHSINTRFLAINNHVDNGDPLNDQSNQSNTLFGEYRSHFRSARKNFDATAGIMFLSTVTNSPLFKGDQKASNYAVYIQLEKQWRRLLLTGGTRYEHYVLNSKEEGKPVFRAGLNYRLTSSTFFRASYGEGYRFPSIAESFITTTVGPVSIYPNDQLQSETGSNIELGVKQGFSIKKKFNILLDIAWFKMEYNNMMEFTFGQWGPITPPLFGVGFKTINTGKSQIIGTETALSFETKLEKIKVQGFVGYTYANSESLEPNKVIAIDEAGTELTYKSTSANSVGNSLKYRPIHSTKGDVIMGFKWLKIGFGITYQSAMETIDTAFVSPPIGFFVPGIQEARNQELSRQFLLNARIGFDVRKKLNINVIMSNLSNSEYMIRPADLGAPRTIRIQVSYLLNKS